MTKPKQILELSETIGDFIEYWGFKRSHGRLWALIYLSDTPPTAAELGAWTGLSKGMLSIALAELKEHGLVQEGECVAYGARTYVAIDDIGTTVRQVLRQRELSMLSDASTQLARLGSHTPKELQDIGVDRQRLRQLEQFTDASRNLLLTFIELNIFSIKDWIKALRQLVKLERASQPTR